MSLDFYEFPAEFFFYGREGALSMGYTFEYPIKRYNATILWDYFKPLAAGNDDPDLKAQILADPELRRDYEIILAEYEEMDFDFGNEGEILEILAIDALYEEFPENMYFITGSVEYHNAAPDDSRTIGELDMFVGRRDTCAAVAVGETKLGRVSALHKARKQLGRFENFLIDHDASDFSDEYVPGSNNDQKKPDTKL